MAEGIIPYSDDGKIVWLEFIEANFPAVGASLGFEPSEIDSFVADCATARFAVNYARDAKNFSKAATRYKKAVLSGKSGKFAAPDFMPSEKPANLTGAGAFRRVQRAVRRMRAHNNYSLPVGVSLRIAGSKSAPLAVERGKPKAKIHPLINSVARIDWTKRGFHGVIIEGQRGDEIVWQRIGTDTRSPFIDARPPLVAGQPEIRRYRLLYVYNDEPVGVWSDIIAISTQP